MGEPARCMLNPAGMYAAIHKEAVSLIHDIFWQCTYLVTTYTRVVLIHFSFNICATV